MDEQRPWHRLFSLTWTDFFRGLPVTVEFEKDLSVKKQLLDVVLIRKEAGELACRLPDGFENLTNYNLVSFKSFREKLSVFALEELVGHYVNLRKQVSSSMDEEDLLPRDQFRLFAVTIRFPRNLLDDGIVLRAIQRGVYQVAALSQRIRVVVVNELPHAEHNALLHLFGANRAAVTYGAEHYRIRSEETSTLLLQLFQRYQEESKAMPDMLEEFTREFLDRYLKTVPVEKRLEGVPVEKRLEGVPVEKLLERVPVERRLEGVPMQKLLAALSPQDREELTRQLQADTSQPKSS